ncbi:hypothetical protein SDC9_175856 [bioreactor metagenome]|uniref:Uncharacterized protein n=1 Tax=bioreactor metagenome TaxID=1076179 RepID=A0A645GNX7_9ZZZZ
MLFTNAPVHGYDGIEKGFHLFGALGHQHRLEIIAVLQSGTNPRNNGINIFKDGSQLNPYHIIRYGGVHNARTYGFRKHFCFLGIVAGNGQEREPFKRDLLGVTGAGYHPDVFPRDFKITHQVFAYHNIVVRYHAFDGRDHKFPL